VVRKNKMGMYVSYMDAIRVIIPRDLYIGDEAYDAVQIGERIKVEIKKSRFQVNDPYILSIGYFHGVAPKNANAKVPPAPNSSPVNEVEDEEEAEVDDADEEIQESGATDADLEGPDEAD
jgi:histidinol phosphatase-like enzyme